MNDDEAQLRKAALNDLDEIGRTIMPFGRYAGRRLHELPAEYLQWFVGKGWPKGRLGVLLQMVYQMKADGSDIAFDLHRPPKARRRKADL